MVNPEDKPDKLLTFAKPIKQGYADLIYNVSEQYWTVHDKNLIKQLA